LIRAAAALAALALAAGCGYHVAGRADLVPKSVKTIAVPSFGNATIRYKLADRLAAAVTRELISRTRYQVVADPNQADAILSGSVVNYNAYPTVFDDRTGRASGVLAIVQLQISLQDRATGKLIYSRPYLEFRERYEISVDQVAYFDESDTAMQRLSRDVARAVVSSILEMF